MTDDRPTEPTLECQPAPPEGARVETLAFLEQVTCLNNHDRAELLALISAEREESRAREAAQVEDLRVGLQKVVEHARGSFPLWVPRQKNGMRRNLPAMVRDLTDRIVELEAVIGPPLGEGQSRLLDRIQKTLGVTTRAALLEKAIGLAEAMADAKNRGDRLVVLNADGDIVADFER